MTLHAAFPLTKRELSAVIADVIGLYPEADAVYVVGTYARTTEKPSEGKDHDIDLLIHFPEGVNRRTIESRDDEPLWRKWSGRNAVKEKKLVDFLFMFGTEESKYGQHQWRLYHHQKTPKVLVWKRR